jgi:hypothetical protein
MKEFLLYIHTQLSRILLLHEASEKLSNEDSDLFESVRRTIMVLQTYAEQTRDGKLSQITDDLEYSICHSGLCLKQKLL